MGGLLEYRDFYKAFDGKIIQGGAELNYRKNT